MSKDNIFGIKIKTYDWMSPDEIALVTPGKASEVYDNEGNYIKTIVIKEPEIVIAKIEDKA